MRLAKKARSGTGRPTANAAKRPRVSSQPGRVPLWTKAMPVQFSLKINAPGDMYEQEADRVADAVMRLPEPAGRPLDTGTRNFMESRFGRDFSPVGVHTDARAARAAREVNALAFTVANDIVLDAGMFRPDSTAGRRLLAHELAHVVQQSGLQSLQAPNIQRTEDGSGEGAAGTCPPLPDPDGDWAKEKWLCEMRQEPWGSNARLLAPGAKGRSVELLHQVMHHWLCWITPTKTPKHTLPDPESDLYTEDTSLVVKDFQKFSHAVMQEGIVGPETISLLDGYVGGPSALPVDCGIPAPDPDPDPDPSRECGPECYDIFGKVLPEDELPDSCNLLCLDKPKPKRKRKPDLMDDKTKEWEAKIDSMATICTPTGVAACVSVGTVFIRSRSAFGGKGRLFMPFTYRGEGGGVGCPAGAGFGTGWQSFTTTTPVGIRDFAGFALHESIAVGAGLGLFQDNLLMFGPVSTGAREASVLWIDITGGAGCGGNQDVDGRLHVGRGPRRL